MTVVDADAHLIETEATWAYMESHEARFRPVSRAASAGASATHAWLIDGREHPRFVGDDASTGTTAATRELLDVEARVRHMDALGIDVQDREGPVVAHAAGAAGPGGFRRSRVASQSFAYFAKT